MIGMKKRVAIFIDHPRCSIQSGNGIIKALSPHYNIKIFTKHELEDGFFDDVDMVCFPGGFGDSDSYDYLFQANGESIRKYVKDGGRYLGICMGAYWADQIYFDILDTTRVERYITQPNTDTHRPHAKAMPVNWNGEQTKMFFYDGCTFKGGNQEVYATYDTGYPMAIIQGKVGLIGCHPESEIHWYKSYSWMRGLYHDGLHHKMLLQFVDNLMEM